MVGQPVLTPVRVLDRRAFLALAAAAGAAAALPAAHRAVPGLSAARLAVPVPDGVWRSAAWSGLLGQELPLAGGGAVRLLEVLDLGRPGGPARFSLLLEPLGEGLDQGIHTVLHPQHGPVPLGATSVGRAGRLQVVVDHTHAPDHVQDQEQHRV